MTIPLFGDANKMDRGKCVSFCEPKQHRTMTNDTPWQHWRELPTTETWCLIAYKWKYSKDQTRINYMVDRTIEGKAQWWGTDPERGVFEILGWKPFRPISVQEANTLNQKQ